jgi:hypothetical protein
LWHRQGQAGANSAVAQYFFNTGRLFPVMPASWALTFRGAWHIMPITNQLMRFRRLWLPKSTLGPVATSGTSAIDPSWT